MIDIYPGFEIRGLSLYVKQYDSLVVSDLQIGYEEDLIFKGVLVPKFQFKDIIDQFSKILKGKKFSKIIINGDFKHEFGRISEQEWREALRLIDSLTKCCDELIFVKGNHDMFLGPIAKKRNIKLVENYLLGDIFFIHGDKKIDIPKNVKMLVIGHEHPAISLKNDTRSEKYKVFLKGNYDGHELIVLPSFNTLTTGTDVLSEKMMSPYLKDNIDNFEIFAVEDEVYYFGKAKDI